MATEINYQGQLKNMLIKWVGRGGAHVGLQEKSLGVKTPSHIFVLGMRGGGGGNDNLLHEKIMQYVNVKIRMQTHSNCMKCPQLCTSNETVAIIPKTAVLKACILNDSIYQRSQIFVSIFTQTIT